jgi:hypothetical protein
MLVVGALGLNGMTTTCAIAQQSPAELELHVTRTLDQLQGEFTTDSPIANAEFAVEEKVPPACPAMPTGEFASHPSCDCDPTDADGPFCCPACPAARAQLDNHVVTADGNPSQQGFVRNEHFNAPEFQMCDELAETMASCLADANIPQDTRRQILQTSMKLLVRNAQLESQARVAQIQLEHERELAVVRGNMLQLQAQMASTGEIKTWIGPLYSNQNQTQQQMNNLMTNLQLVNRTLRLLEKEKEAAERMQANQPLPSGFAVPQPVRQQRPERWSQLPSHSQPETIRRSNPNDQTTQRREQPFLSSSRTSQVAPPRLTDEAVRRQQLESHMRQLQAELDRSQPNQPVQRVGWEQPVAPVRQPLPGANQLRPMMPNSNR